MKTLFDGLADGVVEDATQLCERLESLPLDDKVEALNRIRLLLHTVSPFSSEPVDCVLWVRNESIEGNDYNPNRVAPPEMRLLKLSVLADGYTQPIVSWQKNGDGYEVVDGFHRLRVGREDKAVRDRIHGYLPVTVINSERTDTKDRVAATIRHNRARGVHGVIPMTDVVAMLIRRGWTDDEVAKELGMDADEVLRFKQVKGLPELFRDHEYSKAWE
jgi:ParB-like chromosome segregation protein Spo0J